MPPLLVSVDGSVEMMGERRRRLRGLQTGFHREATRIPRSPAFLNGKPCCWLAPHDPEGRPCAGKWEAFHFVGRQQIRNCATLRGIEQELLDLAEWDVRNGGLGCVEHHRRFDHHATPTIEVHASALPEWVVEFIFDWGLEIEAERKFPHFLVA